MNILMLVIAVFFLIRITPLVWILFQLRWNSCSSKGVLAPMKVTSSQCSKSAVWLSHKSPAAGYKTVVCLRLVLTQASAFLELGLTVVAMCSRRMQLMLEDVLD